ncbi:MAG: ATP-binding protein, partial [Acetivibrio ethanolgignens]
RADQLGKVQPDTRNPVLASAMETLDITENRYSGIPTIRTEMKKYNLPEPQFIDARGEFVVKFYKEVNVPAEKQLEVNDERNLILFCKTPRSIKEICEYLGLTSPTYTIQKYVLPLVEAGVLQMSIPDKPKSPKQLYYSS